jgi:hypothetical protein
VDLVQNSRLSDMVAGKPRMAAGSMSLKLINGSTLKPHPPLHDSLHGEQGDHNDIDEGWSFDEPHGAALFQAIGPTHATRPGAQTFVWSTRGDASSSWFHRLIDRGYDGAGVTLFDWGIPYDGDPDDLDLIERHHPAIGHTIEREFLVAAREAMPDPAEYARAYGNVPTGGTETIIPAAAWTAARTLDPLPEGRPTFGAAVSLDGDHGALVAAVLDPDGRPWLEVIEQRPGRAWLIDRVKALRDYGGGVGVDRRGPAGAVADALELAGVPLLTPTTIDYASGCQDLYDRVTDPAGPRLIHRAAEPWTPPWTWPDGAAWRRAAGCGPASGPPATSPPWRRPPWPRGPWPAHPCPSRSAASTSASLHGREARPPGEAGTGPLLSFSAQSVSNPFTRSTAWSAISIGRSDVDSTAAAAQIAASHPSSHGSSDAATALIGPAPRADRTGHGPEGTQRHRQTRPGRDGLNGSQPHPGDRRSPPRSLSFS